MVKCRYINQATLILKMLDIFGSKTKIFIFKDPQVRPLRYINQSRTIYLLTFKTIYTQVFVLLRPLEPKISSFKDRFDMLFCFFSRSEENFMPSNDLFLNTFFNVNSFKAVYTAKKKSKILLLYSIYFTQIRV
jgi:hypothetical protein